MNKFKLRIYCKDGLIARWIVDEKQKKIIETLIEHNLFYNDVRFEFFEEEEHFKDLT